LTCWNTPWTPQKQPPAKTAVSEAPPVRSSWTGAGITVASSAADTVNTRPTPTLASATAPKMAGPRELPTFLPELRIVTISSSQK